MAMRKSSRHYIHKRFDEIQPEPERIEGFVAIIPHRKEFVGELQKIIDANEGSSRANSKSCWIPFSEDFKAHRYELSDALRAVTESELGGYFQPMSGKDLVLELTVFLPEKSRRMNRLGDILTTLQDAMHFNAWTTDNKRLGLLAESADFWKTPTMKIPRLREGDPEGIRYSIYHEDPGPTIARLLAMLSGEQPSDGQMVSEEVVKQVGLDLAGLGASRETVLRASCLADKDTPLHPEVLRYYKSLLDRFDRKTARRLALYEQTRLDTAVLFDGEESAEAIVEELRGRTVRLEESAGEALLSISEIDG